MRSNSSATETWQAATLSAFRSVQIGPQKHRAHAAAALTGSESRCCQRRLHGWDPLEQRVMNLIRLRSHWADETGDILAFIWQRVCRAMARPMRRQNESAGGWTVRNQKKQ